MHLISVSGKPRLIYYLHDDPSAFRLELAGGLSAANSAELERCWRTGSSTLGAREFVVDLRAVTSVDEAGHRLLRRWSQQGAHFVAESTQARSLVESLQETRTERKAANY